MTEPVFFFKNAQSTDSQFFSEQLQLSQCALYFLKRVKVPPRHLKTCLLGFRNFCVLINSGMRDAITENSDFLKSLKRVLSFDQSVPGKLREQEFELSIEASIISLTEEFFLLSPHI